MIYEYECPQCKKTFEFIRAMADHRKQEMCKDCGSSLIRIISRPTLSISKTDWPEYNPGLGEVVNNRRHRADLAKRRGLIEIGNENMNKIEKKLKREKAERKEREWNQITEQAVCELRS